MDLNVFHWSSAKRTSDFPAHFFAFEDRKAFFALTVVYMLMAAIPDQRVVSNQDLYWIASSFVGLFEVAAYGASKTAVASLSKTLAIEWATSGVCVNALVPGVLRTDLNAALLDGTERGREFLPRTPIEGSVKSKSWQAPRFFWPPLLVVDGRILVSGVNQ
jgi:NAD(P)-dependent dehydrogenase (short-subunit alcohol dehydrogenase family)